MAMVQDVHVSLPNLDNTVILLAVLITLKTVKNNLELIPDYLQTTYYNNKALNKILL